MNEGSDKIEKIDSSKTRMFEDLRTQIESCNSCGINRFWWFPSCREVKGFFGTKDYVFVCPQPHEDEFSPYNIRLDRRFYSLLNEFGFGEAHITDIVKCRREKYNDLNPADVHNCSRWLLKEIKILKPQAIIAVGSRSFKELMKTYLKPVVMIPHYSNYFISEQKYRKIFKMLRFYLDKGTFHHGMKIEEFIKPEDQKKKQKKEVFSEFVTLLNVAKKEGLISTKEWHDYSSQWNTPPYLRNELLQKIKLVIKSHS